MHVNKTNFSFYFLRILSALGLLVLSNTAFANSDCDYQIFGDTMEDPAIQGYSSSGACLNFQTFQPDLNNLRDVIFFISHAGYFTPINARGISNLRVSLNAPHYIYMAAPNEYGYAPLGISSMWAPLQNIVGQGPLFIQAFIRSGGTIHASNMMYVTNCWNTQ